MHVHAKITDNRLPSKHMPTYPHLGITLGCPAEVRIILASRRRAGHAGVSACSEGIEGARDTAARAQQRHDERRYVLGRDAQREVTLEAPLPVVVDVPIRDVA